MNYIWLLLAVFVIIIFNNSPLMAWLIDLCKDYKD